MQVRKYILDTHCIVLTYLYLSICRLVIINSLLTEGTRKFKCWEMDHMDLLRVLLILYVYLLLLGCCYFF